MTLGGHNNILISHIHAGCAKVKEADAVFAALYVQQLAARASTISTSSRTSIADALSFATARRALLELIPLATTGAKGEQAASYAAMEDRGGSYKSTSPKKCKNCQAKYHGSCSKPSKCKICSRGHHTRDHQKATPSPTKNKRKHTCYHYGKNDVSHFSSDCNGTCLPAAASILVHAARRKAKARASSRRRSPRTGRR